MTHPAPSLPGSGPQPVDLLAHGRVITMDAERRLIPDGAVAIHQGRIVAVGNQGEILARYAAKETLGGNSAILLPGFSDCHTHSTQSLVRGLIAGELPMIYRLYIPADMVLTPEEAYQGARLCAAQLALSGVTTMCDFAGDTTPEHEDAIIEGALSVGVRMVLLRGVGDQSAHHAALYSQISDKSWLKVAEGAAERDLARTETLLARAARNPHGMVHAGVCPSSLLGYSERYFRDAAALAERYGVSLQVHAARDREEVEFCLAMFGKRPIERLDELGLINDRLVCVHAILASAGEIDRLGRAGASVAHSAVEIVNILNAIPNVGRMRKAGITVGLGCDNAINDMFTVMHTAWSLQVGIHGLANYEPDILTEDDIFAMATIEAARLLRLDNEIGSLEPRKSADLVVLDGAGPHMMPLQAVPTDLVRFAGRSNVRDVLVAGKAVVRDCRNVTVDIVEMAEAVRPIGAKLAGIVNPRRYRLLRGCC